MLLFKQRNAVGSVNNVTSVNSESSVNSVNSVLAVYSAVLPLSLMVFFRDKNPQLHMFSYNICNSLKYCFLILTPLPLKDWHDLVTSPDPQLSQHPDATIRADSPLRKKYSSIYLHMCWHLSLIKNKKLTTCSAFCLCHLCRKMATHDI